MHSESSGSRKQPQVCNLPCYAFYVVGPHLAQKFQYYVGLNCVKIILSSQKTIPPFRIFNI
jgi:hypothetical protein